jgi:hypothetical protein
MWIKIYRNNHTIIILEKNSHIEKKAIKSTVAKNII